MISSAVTSLTAAITALSVAPMPLEIVLFTSASSLLPLNRTPHAGDLLARPLSGFRHLQHRVEQVARRIGNQILARRIQPSAILQFKIGVETKEIRRAYRSE